MSIEFDVYWSFRSPYCYLAGKRLLEIVRRHDVQCNVRLVRPIAIRIKDFFKDQDPLARRYVFLDINRVAEFNDLPLKWPSPDPIAMNFISGVVSSEQPYIKRLTNLGVAAAEQGRGIEFAVALSSMIFGGTENWDQGDHMRIAAAEAGLDLNELDAAIVNNSAHYDMVVSQNEAAQQMAGHWGVPLMVFDGEPFFGQDRIEHLLWRMQSQGLVSW